MNSSLRVPPHVVFTFVDGDAVLLNTRANKYFALAEVGARFWTLLKDGRNLNEAHQALLAEYDVTAEELENDLLELVGQLLESALVELVEA
ncbi:MAG: PqqD family protein [Chloroflexota bacterium]